MSEIDDLRAAVDALTKRGHRDLIEDGCGHVLTVPHVVVEGDEAHGRSLAPGR